MKSVLLIKPPQVSTWCWECGGFADVLQVKTKADQAAPAPREERASHPGIPPGHPAAPSQRQATSGASVSDKWGLPCRLEASFLSLSYLSRGCLATTFAWAAGDYLPVGACVLRWLVAKPHCVSGLNRAFLPPMGQRAQNVLSKAQNPGSLGSSWMPDGDSFKQTETPSLSAWHAAACASRPFPPKIWLPRQVRSLPVLRVISLKGTSELESHCSVCSPRQKSFHTVLVRRRTENMGLNEYLSRKLYLESGKLTSGK